MDRYKADIASGKAEDWLADIALLLDEIEYIDNDVELRLIKLDGCEILDEIRMNLNTIERYLS